MNALFSNLFSIEFKLNICFVNCFLFTAILYGMLSCDKMPPKTNIIIEGVSAKDGTLTFVNLEAYEKAYQKICGLSEEDRIAWEKSLTFLSQQSIFNQIVNAEYNYFVTPYEKLTEEQLKNTPEPQGHTEAYNKWLKAGIIKTESDNNQGETYNYALKNGAYAPIIDQKGFFIVGKKVYQAKENLIKEMPFVDANSLTVLDQALKSDSTRDIIVNFLTTNEREQKSIGFSYKNPTCLINVSNSSKSSPKFSS
jgi:hypothetical protein